MRLYNVAVRLWKTLLVLAVVSSTYVYLYPLFDGCAFYVSREGEVAPFRLLAFGDPQLEGDTSLPDLKGRMLPSLERLEAWKGSWSVAELQGIVEELVKKDIPRLLESYRKRLDLFGNDRYLAHVYRTVRWWTKPTHTVVLGDLLGSQWMPDEEFEKRSQRFWDTTFKGAVKVPEQMYNYEDVAHEHLVKWDESLITVAGNHDIGYAGDLDESTAKRFEERFGKLNWDITFGLENGKLRTLTRNQAAFAESPRLKLVVLNTMNLDSPALSKELQRDTQHFLNGHAGNAAGQTYLDGTVLLTHIPLYKKEGLCVDGPLFTHYTNHEVGGIREQNHLTEKSSRDILDGLYLYEKTWTRAGIVLNGHDHEGCDIVHSRLVRNQISAQNTSQIGEWTSLPHDLVHDAGVSRDESVREVTVRSMMGAYGGNAGLMSGWFDKEDRRWRFEYQSCMFGVQHIWWAVHILDMITVLVGLALIPLSFVASASERGTVHDRSKKTQ
ncbi:Calcineurin-like phosphoesterase-like protein 5 [Elsinoe fawcettii]|nr:Calcineurin-like phosphoesterase-like protein 5 [Elsinoe fawcettii]